MPGVLEPQSKASEASPQAGISALAGTPAPKERLVDLAQLEREYFERKLDHGDQNQMIHFGTSGHRGSSLDGTFNELIWEFGTPYYARIGAPATPDQKAKLGKLSPASVREAKLAGEPITGKLTRAPANDCIGGLKVVAASGWFAARPSGTENIYKIYAESFKDRSHLNVILNEAQQIVNNALS